MQTATEELPKVKVHRYNTLPCRLGPSGMETFRINVQDTVWRAAATTTEIFYSYHLHVGGAIVRAVGTKPAFLFYFFLWDNKGKGP